MNVSLPILNNFFFSKKTILIFKTQAFESTVFLRDLLKLKTKTRVNNSLYVIFLIKSPLLFSAYHKNDFLFIP